MRDLDEKKKGTGTQKQKGKRHPFHPKKNSVTARELGKQPVFSQRKEGFRSKRRQNQKMVTVSTRISKSTRSQWKVFATVVGRLKNLPTRPGWMGMYLSQIRRDTFPLHFCGLSHDGVAADGPRPTPYARRPLWNHLPKEPELKTEDLGTTHMPR